MNTCWNVYYEDSNGKLVMMFKFFGSKKAAKNRAKFTLRTENIIASEIVIEPEEPHTMMQFIKSIAKRVNEVFDSVNEARQEYKQIVRENHAKLIRGSVLDPDNHPSKDV